MMKNIGVLFKFAPCSNPNQSWSSVILGLLGFDHLPALKINPKIMNLAIKTQHIGGHLTQAVWL